MKILGWLWAWLGEYWDYCTSVAAFVCLTAYLATGWYPSLPAGGVLAGIALATVWPERMRRTLAKWEAAGVYWRKEDMIWCGPVPWPLPNVWLGTSIETDDYTRRADELRETPAAVRFLSLEPLLGPLPSLSFEGIDWAIIGGESGPDARELDLGWVRDLMRRAHEAGTAVFIKQLGSVAARKELSMLADSHGGDWDHWPDWLRVREYPRVPERTFA